MSGAWSGRAWGALLLAALCGCQEPAVEVDDDEASGGPEVEPPGDGDGDDDGTVPDEPDAELPEVAPPTLRRLMAYQYRNTIRDLLGEDAAAVVVAPEDFAISGMRSIGAAQLAVGNMEVIDYERSALNAADAFFAGGVEVIDPVLGCTPSANDDPDCAEVYIETFGRRAFRRPLDGDEHDRFVALHEDGVGEYESFYGGVYVVMAAMLQSPSFLYLTEIGEPDPEDPTQRRLTSYELASKLSYFLLGTTPDDELLDAAATGTLHNPDALRDIARLLLTRPEAPEALDDYFVELYDLELLDQVIKVPAAFPQLDEPIDTPVALSPVFGESARTETLMLLHDIIWERDVDFREILTSRTTFSNPVLDLFYFGTPIEPDADFETFYPVEPPESQGRAGILSHIGLLSILARSNRTAPTVRGKFIRNELLCDSIPPPPDDVEFDLPPDEDAVTMREKLQQHQEDPACSGCHIPLDNLGFALEHYDGLGFYRTLDNGEPVDASAELGDLGDVDGARDLGDALFASPRIPACAVTKLYRHATGHIETAGERPVLDALTESFANEDYRFQALMVELVASPTFQRIADADQDQGE